MDLNQGVNLSGNSRSSVVLVKRKVSLKRKMDEMRGGGVKIRNEIGFHVEGY